MQSKISFAASFISLMLLSSVQVPDVMAPLDIIL